MSPHTPSVGGYLLMWVLSAVWCGVVFSVLGSFEGGSDLGGTLG